MIASNGIDIHSDAFCICFLLQVKKNISAFLFDILIIHYTSLQSHHCVALFVQNELGGH